MKLLIDHRMKNIFLNYFIKNDIKCIKLNSITDVYEEVASHPDIFAININGKLICSSNIDFKNNNVNYIVGEYVEKGYPNTSKFNVCVTSKYAICNTKNISKVVYNEILKNNLEIIHVNQGYTKCSLIALNDYNYITSDIGIKNVLENKGFNVLYMPDEDIKLLNKDSSYSEKKGFIGGATCIIENKIILFGDVRKLEKGQAFQKFVTNLGYELIDFKDEDIIDYGSAVVIE